MTDKNAIRQDIRVRVADFHRASSAGKQPFRPGVDYVHFAGRVHDADEIQCMVDASLDFWLTAGRFAEEFEAGLAEFLGLDNVLLVNSGSSANLVAFSTLTCPKLGERRVKPGRRGHHRRRRLPDDGQPDHPEPRGAGVRRRRAWAPTCPTIDAIEAAIGPRTKAVMIAHTLGIPFDLRPSCASSCDRHGLWLIEDSCDALGTHVRRAARSAPSATWPRFSFYPAHHITMGEGGAVVTANDELARIARSLPRLGPRLLLRRRREQHLRQALRRSSSARCPSATTTSTSTPTSATT